MGSVRPYIVKEGDHLAGLAVVHGFDAAEVWDHPKNAALKAAGRTPELLAPGDVLSIPDEPADGADVALQSDNAFQGKIPPVSLTLYLRSGDAPLPNEPCVVTGANDPAPTATDGDGKLEISVTALTREIDIYLPRLDLIVPVAVGGLDPLTTASGRAQRLANLGYYRAPSADGGGGDDPFQAAALSAFLSACGEPEGAPVDDDVLAGHLRDQHKS